MITKFWCAAANSLQYEWFQNIHRSTSVATTLDRRTLCRTRVGCRAITKNLSNPIYTRVLKFGIRRV